MRLKHLIKPMSPRAHELEQEATQLRRELIIETLGFRRAKIDLRTALIDEMTRRPR